MEDVVLFVLDRNGQRWNLEGNTRISELLSNEIWSARKAVSEDQETSRVVTSRLQPKEMERLYFVVRRRQTV